ncbi:MAG: hypothetical protein FJZ47_00720 [Candidatus Tectomicrobia bacterium]|uniref:Uncharacterized protein n=1 Tax=Tectimicrobiota bacterium TaxID=2528274 RepID=A0A938B0T5_UNCTE|nr:hypothetical protein [Candidatus Tectomicrobia bacterium]
MLPQGDLLNFASLSSLAQDAARQAWLRPVCRDPLHNIIVRSIEILYARNETLRLIKDVYIL